MEISKEDRAATMMSQPYVDHPKPSTHGGPESPLSAGVHSDANREQQKDPENPKIGELDGVKRAKNDNCYVVEPATLSDDDEGDEEFRYGAELEDELRAALFSASGRGADTAGGGDGKNVSTAAPLKCEHVNELDDFEQLMRETANLKKEQGTGEFESENVPRIGQRHESQADFIRSFLVEENMHKTLRAFQTEWYSLRLKEAGMNSDIVAKSELEEVPSALLSNQQLKRQIASLEQELGRQREIASRALGWFDRFKKERDFHRLHHRRLTYEKEKYIQEVKNLNRTLEVFSSERASLQQKVRIGIRECSIVKLERDKLVAEIKLLKQTVGLPSSSVTDEPAAENVIRHRTPATSVAPGGQKSGSSKVVNKDQHSPIGLDQQNTAKDSKWPTTRRVFSRVVPPAPSQCPGSAQSASRAASSAEPYVASEEEFGPGALWASHADRVNCVNVVEAHDAAVVSLATHSRIDLMVTTSDDGTWKIWQIPGGHLIMAGSGHKDWVSSAAFHPSTSVLVTASGDGTAKLWSISEERCMHTFADHTKPVWDCCFHDTGDFFATASMDNSIRCFDANSLRCRQILKGHTDSVNAICFQPCTNCIASVSSDKNVNFWDMRTGTLVRKFAGHRQSCNDVSFSLQGTCILSCDAEGVVHMWDLRRMSHWLQFDCGPAAANSCTADVHNTVIVVPSSDCTINLLDIKERNLINKLKGHTDYVLDVHFSKDDTYFCSGGADGQVRVWQ